MNKERRAHSTALAMVRRAVLAIEVYTRPVSDRVINSVAVAVEHDLLNGAVRHGGRFRSLVMSATALSVISWVLITQFAAPVAK